MSAQLTNTTATKILVVDDDRQLRRVFRALLASQGCTVIEARDGYEAIEEIKAENPDLVFLDIIMPGIDGLETCKRIREFSIVPIIMVTVRGDEKDKVLAFDAGADDYIVKPFGTRELLARVRAAARRAPGAERTPQRFNSAGLEIDFESRRVIANGRRVRLTPIEFELLKQLVLNQGKPVPHLQLLQVLWGPDHSSDRQYLRVYIGHLRKKIEPNPDQPRYIDTEPGIGYRFDPNYGTLTKTQKSNL